MSTPQHDADTETHRLMENDMTYVPNRKVVAGAITGALTLVGFMAFGPEVGPDFAVAATATLMTIISYLVPLADDDHVPTS